MSSIDFPALEFFSIVWYNFAHDSDIRHKQKFRLQGGTAFLQGEAHSVPVHRFEGEGDVSWRVRFGGGFHLKDERGQGGRHRSMIDTSSKDYASISYLDDGEKESKLFENQAQLLKVPVCRNGKTKATVGMDTDVWKTWN